MYIVGIVVLALLVLSVPIGIALSAASAAYILVDPLLEPTVIFRAFFSFIGRYSLMAIPLFIFAGFLMERTGLVRQLFQFSDALVGWMPGGFGAATVLACVLFGAISGSSVAMAAAMSVIAIPEMRSRGYPDWLSAGLVATAGGIAMLIPPSIILTNPVVMAFGEVPSAMESGVIDGLMTSLGGWNSMREQAPYYTMGGAGAFVGDYYMVSASRRWWDRLSPAQRDAMQKLIAETIQVQKEYNWCFDKMAYEKYGTKDPAKPGVYWMSPEEVSAMVNAMGDAAVRYVKSKTPAEAAPWVDRFVQEGRELSKQHPSGSSWIEKVDCSKHASVIKIK